MATSRLCSIPNCGKAHKGHGYCHLHLGRWKKSGDPHKARRYPRRGEPIEYLLSHMWDDCPKWPFARGVGGYGRIQILGKVQDVHRVVCEMINGEPPTPEHEAAHSCGKGSEGCFGARCLSWKSAVDNHADKTVHGTLVIGSRVKGSKLTEADVLRIRTEIKSRTARNIAAQYGVHPSTIDSIISGKSWAWLN